MKSEREMEGDILNRTGSVYMNTNKRYNAILIQLLLLSEGLPAVVFGHIRVQTTTEGQDIEVKCQFKKSGHKRLFCKTYCDKNENILVETTGDRGEKDRYSIQYDVQTNIMTVGIKKVQLSDSGQYQCKLERTFWFNSMWSDAEDTFQISVLKVKKPTPRVPPVIQTTTAVRPTQRPGPSPSPDSNSSATTRPEHELQSEAPHRSSQTGSVLYIGVTLAVILMIFSVVLLIFYCKKKENKPTEFAVNRELGEVPEVRSELQSVCLRSIITLVYLVLQ
ncbi:hypothetical protein NL108_006497 [Boleophthalmus pectinirostris]|nr:hypothetical protein NL108_006497 [Boleophthalmus pectinirostris]